MVDMLPQLGNIGKILVLLLEVYILIKILANHNFYLHVNIILMVLMNNVQKMQIPPLAKRIVVKEMKQIILKI